MADNLFGVVEYTPDDTILIEDNSDFGNGDFDEIEEIGREKKIPLVENKKKTKEELEEEEKKKKPSLTTKTTDVELIEIKDDEKIIENDEKKPASEEEEEESVNQFTIYSENLYELGIFKSQVDDQGKEIKPIAEDEESFQQLWKDQSRNSASEWLEGFLSHRGEEAREIFDAIIVNGVDPKEYFPVYNNVKDFSTVDLQVEGNSEKVVREYLKRQGLPEDKINSKIERLRSISELDNEAEDALPLIIKDDEKRLADMQEQKKQKDLSEQRQDVEYRASIVRILQEKLKSREFDGIPLDDTTADKALDFMYTKKWKLGNGRQITDYEKYMMELDRPENHQIKVKNGLLALSNFDLTRIQKKAVSNEKDGLWTRLKGKEIKQANKTKTVDNNDWE